MFMTFASFASSSFFFLLLLLLILLHSINTKFMMLLFFDDKIQSVFGREKSFVTHLAPDIHFETESVIFPANYDDVTQKRCFDRLRNSFLPSHRSSNSEKKKKSQKKKKKRSKSTAVIVSCPSLSLCCCFFFVSKVVHCESTHNLGNSSPLNLISTISNFQDQLHGYSFLFLFCCCFFFCLSFPNDFTSDR